MIRKISIDSLLWFLVIFVCAMTVAQFLIGIKLSTTGSELSKLERQWSTIVRENQKLKEEIAVHASLSQVSTKALELGLKEPQEIIYLTIAESQAHLSSANKQ